MFVPRWTLALAGVSALILYLAMPWLPLPWHFPAGGWLRAHTAAARQVFGHGSWSEIAAFQVREIPVIAMLHGYVFPRTVALMLVGALAWRSGLLARSGVHARLFLHTAMTALVFGFLLSLAGKGNLPGIGAMLPPFTLTVADALAPVVMTIGYAALVVWLVPGTSRVPLLAWAAPVGRMAFTNYVVQSLALSLIFYGYGLGLVGRLGIAAGFGLAVALYTVQAVISRLWLGGHWFGPLEWLWRTATYGTRQPWRKRRLEGPGVSMG